MHPGDEPGSGNANPVWIPRASSSWRIRSRSRMQDHEQVPDVPPSRGLGRQLERQSGETLAVALARRRRASVHDSRCLSLTPRTAPGSRPSGS